MSDKDRQKKDHKRKDKDNVAIKTPEFRQQCLSGGESSAH
jgi:hypothetical protein